MSTQIEQFSTCLAGYGILVRVIPLPHPSARNRTFSIEIWSKLRISVIPRSPRCRKKGNLWKPRKINRKLLEPKLALWKGRKKWDIGNSRRPFALRKGGSSAELIPQTYEVIDSRHKKIGMFKSGEGFLPDLEAVNDPETPHQIA